MYKWLMKLLAALLGLFGYNPEPRIPYKPVKPDGSLNWENTDLESVLFTMFSMWDVSSEHWPFWRSTVLHDYDYYESEYYKVTGFEIPEDENGNSAWGAWSVDWPLNDLIPGYLYVTAPNAQPGILAHEMAHISMGLLSDEEWRRFEEDYDTARQKDELLNYLTRQEYYQPQNDISYRAGAHAEVYRYLGHQMPEAMKPYYPRLI